jgi:hypothetical protein
VARPFDRNSQRHNAGLQTYQQRSLQEREIKTSDQQRRACHFDRDHHFSRSSERYEVLAHGSLFDPQIGLLNMT